MVRAAAAGVVRAGAAERWRGGVARAATNHRLLLHHGPRCRHNLLLLLRPAWVCWRHRRQAAHHHVLGYGMRRRRLLQDDLVCWLLLLRNRHQVPMRPHNKQWRLLLLRLLDVYELHSPWAPHQLLPRLKLQRDRSANHARCWHQLRRWVLKHLLHKLLLLLGCWDGL